MALNVCSGAFMPAQLSDFREFYYTAVLTTLVHLSNASKILTRFFCYCKNKFIPKFLSIVVKKVQNHLNFLLVILNLFYVKLINNYFLDIVYFFVLDKSSAHSEHLNKKNGLKFFFKFFKLDDQLLSSVTSKYTHSNWYVPMT